MRAREEAELKTETRRRICHRKSRPRCIGKSSSIGALAVLDDIGNRLKNTALEHEEGTDRARFIG